jgi:hypothetical protein
MYSEYQVFFSDNTTLNFYGYNADLFIGGSGVDRIYNWTKHSWTWIRD